jgi:hypothetical protein
LFGWRIQPHEATAIAQLDLAQLFPGDYAAEEATSDRAGE